MNALRGHLAEFGIVTRQGIAGVGMLIGLAEDKNNELIPLLARDALVPLVRSYGRRTRSSVSPIIRFTPGTARMN
ncbi:hypothetical protein [Mesorhizobium sp. M1217]|uniref:hypothetical protein n=1 Tax=Mesorhizobium sp. M1217 TaxID=2957070 RepID=UPI003334CEC7